MDSTARQLTNLSDDVSHSKRGTYERKDLTLIDDNVNLVDSPIYNDEQMKIILDGIVQNVWQKMDANGLRMSALSDLSTVPYGTLSKIFNYSQAISLKNLIKLAFALRVSPTELFPYDLNRRKTNGDRFEEITKGLDVESVNYLLNQAADFARLRSR